ncbi:MAG: hypothetical protein IKE92_09210 [Clostridiales bacterium]|nr:hypothetical protein [Clostridiales bacterium]
MRLQSLNCPNCGSPLRTENNMQICDSCGSTFRIDYDDSDVAYERLSKEDEIARQKFEHEKEMLETEYRLKEEARIKQAKYEKSEARKKRAANKVKALISLLIMLGVFCGFMFLVFMVIKGESLFDVEKIAGTTTTETTVSPYLIDASDVLADDEFMENAVASVLSEIHSSRDGKPVTIYDIPITDWYMTGEPEIYDCYILTSEKENRLCFLVKYTYQSERDEDDIKEVYDCLYLRNITVGNNGKISSDYAVRIDRGEGATNWTWVAAEDSDQLYRSAILAQSEFSRDKVILPVSILPSNETEETLEETDEDDDADSDEDYDED